jgi:hypothetical protein
LDGGKKKTLLVTGVAAAVFFFFFFSGVCPEKPCFAWHVTATKAAFFFLEDFILLSLPLLPGKLPSFPSLFRLFWGHICFVLP